MFKLFSCFKAVALSFDKSVATEVVLIPLKSKIGFASCVPTPTISDSITGTKTCTLVSSFVPTIAFLSTGYSKTFG